MVSGSLPAVLVLMAAHLPRMVSATWQTDAGAAHQPELEY
jgi:hypothetical protein